MIWSMPHPLRDVCIVGVHNTKQARTLPGHDSRSISLEAALGALADAGLTPADVDGVVSQFAQEVVHELRLGPCSRHMNGLGIPAVMQAAGLVASGDCDVVLMASGGAQEYTEITRATEVKATAPWTRPANEFVVSYGLMTPAEFALVARKHMLRYGTTAEQLATVAATIRNNGHVNPEAVYFGKGPFTVDDILASRMVADPFHLLECATANEGGCGLVLTTWERAQDLPNPPVFILGGGNDSFGPSYQMAPAWDMQGGRGVDIPLGYVGRRAARRAFANAGLRPQDVDVCEFYDPFSFEIIRQFEAFEFCGEGEGGAFVTDGRIGPGGEFPVTTDGGTMSYSHAGLSAQMLQRVIRGVQQLRGTCPTMQVPGAEVAMCSNGGSGALFTDVMLLGKERP
jgi:acetyl-CoA acetyltransferase